MTQILEDLGWPEAKLFDLSFIDNNLKFSMLDILTYDDPLKYEIVNVSISEIEALRIELIPFVNGAYQSKIVPIDFGVATENDEGFEGTISENPLTEISAEYFWISSDLRAKKIEIERTGKYEYISRAD